ncbi:MULTISPECIES: DUF4192 family protein [Gulosibacter]|uniref:DUF4192 family protein n=1 Tax=Gulosibacter TaxID=256818 RepID=UPI000F631393|nr:MULTISPECIES: DUF4192 family protein [Gulosibacter]
MTSPRILTSIHEVLRTIPEVLGFTPTESLVVIPFSGGPSSAMIRVDLPQPAGDDAEHFSHAVLEHVLRLGDVERVFFAVFTSKAHAGEIAPYTIELETLARQSRRLGLHIVGGACVAGDAWSEYWGARGGPRDEVVSALAPVIPADVSEATEIASAPEEARSRVEELLAEHARLAEITDDEVLCAWNLYLDGARWLDPEYEPILVALVSRGLRRLRTLELIVANGALGSEICERVEAIWLDLAENMPEAELTGLTEVFADFIPADLARVDRAISALRSIASHVSEREARGALAALAWLTCLAGRASIASEYARRALRAGHHALAAQVLERIDQGYVPGWVVGSGCAGPGRYSELDDSVPE